MELSDTIPGSLVKWSSTGLIAAVTKNDVAVRDIDMNLIKLFKYAFLKSSLTESK